MHVKNTYSLVDRLIQAKSVIISAKYVAYELVQHGRLRGTKLVPLRII